MAAPDIERRQAMDSIYRRIDRTRRLWRAARAADGLARALLVVSLGLLAGVVAALFDPPAWVWLVWAVAVAGAGLYELLRRVVLPLFRPITDEMVARHLERAAPEMDNRMINAVLLGEERFRDSLADHMVTDQVSQTASDLGRTLPVRTNDLRSLRRVVPAAVVSLALLVGAGLLFPGQAQQALGRLVRPYRRPPVAPTATLSVVPGHAEVLQGSPLIVEAHVRDFQSATVVHVGPEGEETAFEMPFKGHAFVHEFANVQRDFRYRVEAGEAVSETFSVAVLKRPEVRELAVGYEYPDYTGLPPRVEQGSAGDVLAPSGSRVTLTATLDRPVEQAVIQLELLPEESGGEPRRTSRKLEVLDGGRKVRAELHVRTSGSYKLKVTDAAGFSNLPVQRHIEAGDRVPRVTVTEPDRDLTLGPDGKLDLRVVAEDDFNVRSMDLLVSHSDPNARLEDVPELRQDDSAKVQRIAHGRATLDVAALGLDAGATLTYRVRAGDGRAGQYGMSRAYRLRVAGAEVGGADTPAAAVDMEAVVRRLIRMQQANLNGTRDLLDSALEPDQDAFHEEARELVLAEDRIATTADEAARSEPAETRSTLGTALQRLAAGPITDAAERLRDLENAPDGAALPERGRHAMAAQQEVIRLLEALLDNPAAALAHMLREEENTEELGEQVEDLYDARQTAEKMLRQMKKFREEQREIIELSNELAAKEVDDFTEEDKALMEQIAATERKWGKIFQEMATDLSKLPPQDHSLAGQQKELLEVYSEVNQAAEAAEREAIELAVPKEQAGAELAESIETNLEKWLMEDKDSDAWKMEDPTGDYETPITELPEELQDLMGELVEDEEDMEEQFDDATSGWMDSLDKGAGWDTADGPISNMSAKGVTGNRMPNTSEIGGRSGEGRTGKSSGQFVEEEATGKGGRDTPSRLTPDPFEAGSVKDSSQEAGTGSTGGGKDSGQGQEGFQGPVPPPIQDELKRMASMQQEMIEKARRIDYGLKKYGYPRGELPQTIEIMERIQRDLAEGEINTFTKYRRVVLTDLRDVKEQTAKVKATRRDRSMPLPKELRDEIASAENEPMPEQYEPLIRSYFRALSEEGTR
jgi:hypothetical protein